MVNQYFVSYFFLVCLIGLLFYRLLRIGRRPADYPPGPPTIPILGNIHLMPSHDVHKQFQKWAIEYGPIYSLILGTKILIIISSDTVVKELLDKRGNIYSDRPEMYIGMTICSGGLRVLMMRYGPTWRMIRKLIHNILNVISAKSWEPYQDLENKQMLYEILEQPDGFLRHVRRYSNSLTTSMTYGWRTPTYGDQALQSFFKIFEEFTITTQSGTAALLDCFPPLRRLPNFLLPMRRHASALHQREKTLFLSLWLKAKHSILSDSARPSFSHSLLVAQKEHFITDDLAAYIAGSLLEAGSDTTSNTLYAFLLAMITHPTVQAKAHAELDAVIGSSRLPNLADESNLPYLRACVKETLRWRPTLILGVPHAATRDDEYMGYRIPRGAGIISNIYTIHQDPTRYPQPKIFDPERFENDTQSALDAATNADVGKRDHFAFGAGRRICQGMHIAESNLFLGMARMLWAFEFRTKGGKEVADVEGVTQGFVSAPLPFEADIQVRSAGRADVVRGEWERARAAFLEEGTEQWKELPVEVVELMFGGRQGEGERKRADG